MKEAPLHLKDLLPNQPHNGLFYSIAVDGRGGSGKSSLAKYLKTLLPDLTVLNGDDYFEPFEGQLAWGGFNDKRFRAEVIEPLRHGPTFTYRPYDWHSQPNITEKQITVGRGLLLERGHSFSFDLDWDLKIWVETPKETCLERGIARELMPKDRVIQVWTTIWQPKEDVYIAGMNPTSTADLVVDGTLDFARQLVA